MVEKHDLIGARLFCFLRAQASVILSALAVRNVQCKHLTYCKSALYQSILRSTRPLSMLAGSHPHGWWMSHMPRIGRWVGSGNSYCRRIVPKITVPRGLIWSSRDETSWSCPSASSARHLWWECHYFRIYSMHRTLPPGFCQGASFFRQFIATFHVRGGKVRCSTDWKHDGTDPLVM